MAELVDIYIAVRDIKSAISITLYYCQLDKLSYSTFEKENYSLCWVFWNSDTNLQTMYYINCFVGS